MKKLLITIALISVSLAATAQKNDHVIIVHAQGATIKLYDADVKYIFSKTGNIGTRSLLRSQPQTIRNNDVADLIIAIMKEKKSGNK